MKKIIINIQELLQIREQSILKVSGKDMAELPKINNAYLLIEDNLISDFGPMENCPEKVDAHIIDAKGKVVLPTWCDSHTHLVYAGNRVQEFVDRIKAFHTKKLLKKEVGF